MKETTNFKLKKIDLTDSPPDITVINPNWDTIDSELKQHDDHIASVASETQSGHVEIADALETATGTDAAKAISPKNLKGETEKLIAHSLATAANDFLVASAASKFVKKTLAEVKNILGLKSAAYTDSTAYASSAHSHTAADVGAASTGHNHDSVYETPSGAQTKANTVQSNLSAHLAEKTVYCSAYHNVSQSLASGVGIVLAFNTNDSDIYNMHNGDNKIFTCVQDGVYDISSSIVFTNSSTGVRALGYDYKYTDNWRVLVDAVSTNETRLNMHELLKLKTGDIVKIVAMQSTSGSLNVTEARVSLIKVGYNI